VCKRWPGAVRAPERRRPFNCASSTTPPHYELHNPPKWGPECNRGTGLTQTIRNDIHTRAWRSAIRVPMTHNHLHAYLQWPRYQVAWTLNVDNGTLTAQRYVSEVFDVDVLVQRAQTFVLIDDNQNELCQITELDWPMRILRILRNQTCVGMQGLQTLSQLNISGTCLREQFQSTTVQELRHALLEEWVGIPQDDIRWLISSMKRQWQAVFNTNGHYTRYWSHLNVVWPFLRLISALSPMPKNLKSHHPDSTIVTLQW